MDGQTNPCPAAAFALPLSRDRFGPQNCTVCVPEIDPTCVPERRVFALEECRESGDALGKESFAEDCARATLADLKHVSRVDFGFRADLGRLAIR